MTASSKFIKDFLNRHKRIVNLKNTFVGGSNDEEADRIKLIGRVSSLTEIAANGLLVGEDTHQ